MKRTQQKLSPKQHQVYMLSVTAGRTAKEIASELNIAPDTAHKHLTVIYHAFRVKNQPQLIVDYWKSQAKA